MKEKKIAVLGAGKSGVAAARLGFREGASISVRDNGSRGVDSATRASLHSSGIELLEGDAALESAAACDLAVLSPGVDPRSALACAFTDAGVPLVGEIEFADRFNDRPVVAITGTNGKTTTTEIVARILSAGGQRSVAAGNYGRAFSDVLLSLESYDVITLEVSSFQLESIVDFRPRISVWLNFAPDHLDRYKDLEEYREAKLRIFENQRADDFAVINVRDEVGAIAPAVTTFSAFEGSGDYRLEGAEILFREEPICDFGSIRLRGRHNAENLMAALEVGRLRGLSFPEMERAVSDYTPPAHRGEWVGNVAGHDFINDSKATNLHALEQSLRSQREAVVLIAGGVEKGLDFASISAAVKQKVSHVVAIGECRGSILAAWAATVACESAEGLEEAVSQAVAAAAPGQTVLFSPGTSSFDMFKSYEERGDFFRDIVNRQQ
ncbi:MAG: UDP-N-acetylmuramoyl-L-alanine--D-glutamate ligase [Verrucomicrobiales bacterium]